MSKWAIRIACAFAVVIISILCISVSDKYFDTIAGADNKNNQVESDEINGWYDENEEKNDVAEENDKNNSEGEFAPGGGTDSEGNEENPFKHFTNDYKDGLSVYNAAEKAVQNVKGLEIEMRGNVRSYAMGQDVNQKTRALRKRDKSGKIYFQGVSAGLIETGVESYYDTRLFKYRNCSKVNSNLTGNFGNTTPSSTSIPAYEKMFGAMPDQMLYIVNANTLDKIENFKYENKLYTFDMHLKVSAAEKYKYNVMTMAGGKSPATFSKIMLKVTIDDTGRFKEIIYQESYTITTVVMGVSVTAECNTNLVETYKVVHGDVEVQKPW